MKLTNHQRKLIYQYWRAQGVSPAAAARSKNNIFAVFEHAAQLKRFGLDNSGSLKGLRLTPTQEKELFTQFVKKGVEIDPAIARGLPAGERVKYLARVRGYLKAISVTSKRAPKKLLAEFRNRLSSAESENEIYRMIRESYSQGLKPRIEYTETGERKFRI